jgi:predicted DNA-binding transcriptional regulator AlpA
MSRADTLTAALVSQSDIARAAGLSVRTLARRRQAGQFPEPIRVSSRCLRWPREVIDRLPELLGGAR